MALQDRRKDLFIQRASDIIEANLNNDRFSVSELAQRMNISRSNLHRRIKSDTGKSVSSEKGTLPLGGVFLWRGSVESSLSKATERHINSSRQRSVFFYLQDGSHSDHERSEYPDMLHQGYQRVPDFKICNPFFIARNLTDLELIEVLSQFCFSVIGEDAIKILRILKATVLSY